MLVVKVLEILSEVPESKQYLAQPEIIGILNQIPLAENIMRNLINKSSSDQTAENPFSYNRQESISNDHYRDVSNIGGSLAEVPLRSQDPLENDEPKNPITSSQRDFIFSRKDFSMAISSSGAPEMQS